MQSDSEATHLHQNLMTLIRSNLITQNGSAFTPPPPHFYTESDVYTTDVVHQQRGPGVYSRGEPITDLRHSAA